MRVVTNNNGQCYMAGVVLKRTDVAVSMTGDAVVDVRCYWFLVDG